MVIFLLRNVLDIIGIKDIRFQIHIFMIKPCSSQIKIYRILFKGIIKFLKMYFGENGYKGEKMPYIVPILSIGEGEHISLDIKRDGKQSSDIFVESDLEDSSVYDYPKTIAPNQDSFAITCLKMQDKISLLKFFSDESKEEQCGELVIIPKSLVFCKNVEIVFCKVYIVDSGRNLNTVFGNYRLQLLNKKFINLFSRLFFSSPCRYSVQ